MFRKIGLKILFIVLVVLLGFSIFLYLQIRELKPHYAGQLQTTQIANKVAIRRDSSGVIHIKGQNVPDVILASGFAAAQDRLWQMEILRMIGKGKLSSVFGEKTVDLDKLFLTLGVDSINLKNYSFLSDESKNWLKQYARGVNLYIQNEKNLPIEFLLLKIKPQHWSPQDCLLQTRIMAWLLNFNWKADILYWYLSLNLPPVKFREILPSWDEYPDIIKAKKLKAFIGKVNQLNQKISSLIGLTSTVWGSNNWVISPKLAAQGKAMLANDPHLPLQLPSIWIEMHLEAPGMNVAGFGLPGSPGIIVGRNEHIAWGVTNGMIDDSDYFIEKVDTMKKIYWVDNKEKKLIVQNVRLEIKNKSPLYFNVFRTANGPLFNHLYPQFKLPGFISFKWEGWEMSDEIQTFIHLARAKNWQEFSEALEHFTLPAQNFVYADVNGNIGYRLGGKVPIRSYGEGLIPMEGSTSKNKWMGWIPFQEMPHIFNPESGLIVTANNEIVKNYHYYLSDLWEPPYRAIRIEQLLRKSSRHNLASFKQIQADHLNLLAKDVLPGLLDELKSRENLDEVENKILFLLQNWDFESDAESIAASYYEILQYFLIENIFKDEMGRDAFELFTDLPNFFLRIFSKVIRNERSAWFDDVRTNRTENRRDIILKSAQMARDYLQNNVSENVSDWNWGQLHQLVLKHTLGEQKMLGMIFNRGPFQMGGSGTTVNVATYRYLTPFNIIAGPSMRFVVNWAEKQSYHSILAGGNSGKLLSPFYDNQIDDWKNGELKNVKMKTGNVRSEYFLVPSNWRSSNPF